MTTLSFTVLEDLTPDRMLFIDTSIYGAIPVSPIVNIKFPDFKKIYSTNIEFGQINILNTARLKYVDGVIDFPDGIYEIEYTANNGTCVLKKTIFRTVKAFVALDKVMKTWDLDNKYLLENFNKINLYLHGAKSKVEVDEYQAQQHYKQAIELLNCNKPNGMQLFEKHC